MSKSSAPLRVVSLLPSATEMVDLVLQEDKVTNQGVDGAILVGRSHECDYPPYYKDLPMLTSSKIKFTSSADVDRQVKEELAAGNGLYSVDQPLLASLRPDFIVTQSLCKVCSVDFCKVESIAKDLDPQPKLLDTNPQCLAEVLEDVVRIGAALGMEDQGHRARDRLQKRVDAAVIVAKELGSEKGGVPSNVAFCEWTDPIFVGGHWTPELIEMAGGRHSLNPTRVGGGAGNSSAITHATFVESDPDVIIICPCGLDLPATKKELTPLTSQPWWSEIRAVKEGKVWLVDGNQMFNRPGPRLVDCLEWLVSVLHERPDLGPEGGFPAEQWKASSS